MKVVTKRYGTSDPINDARLLQETLNQLKGGMLVPTGVYRFRSFEEADEWMIKEIATTHARQKSKI